MQDWDKLKNTVDIPTIIDTVDQWDLPLVELVDSILNKVGTITIWELKNRPFILKHLLKTQSENEVERQRITDISQYLLVKKELQDSEEIINKYKETDYIKFEGEIYEIFDTKWTTKITYNALDNTFSVFYYDWDELKPLLLGLENINKTNIKDWWKVDEKTEEARWLGSMLWKKSTYTTGWYYYLWEDWKTKYLEWWTHFSELQEHWNIVYFLWNMNYASNDIIIACREKIDTLPAWDIREITLDNWRHFLLLSYSYGSENQVQSLYDADNMELLLDKVCSITIIIYENKIYYEEEEERYYPLAQNLWGPKKVEEELDISIKMNS